MLPAKFIQQFLAADTQGRLEGGRAVVDARVDDLAVAGRGFLAGSQMALQEEGGWVAGRKGAGSGEAYGAGAYYLDKMSI